MPDKYDKIPNKIFQSNLEYEEWKKLEPNSWSFYRSQLKPCTICTSSNKHKMRTRYGQCNNKDCFANGLECPKHYNINSCEKSGKMNEIGEHSGKNFIRVQYGLSDTVKELVEDFIHNDCYRPKRIHVKLAKKKYRKKFDIMPTLTQIQDYIKNKFFF